MMSAIKTEQVGKGGRAEKNPGKSFRILHWREGKSGKRTTEKKKEIRGLCYCVCAVRRAAVRNLKFWEQPQCRNWLWTKPNSARGASLGGSGSPLSAGFSQCRGGSPHLIFYSSATSVDRDSELSACGRASMTGWLVVVSVVCAVLSFPLLCIAGNFADIINSF